LTLSPTPTPSLSCTPMLTPTFTRTSTPTITPCTDSAHPAYTLFPYTTLFRSGTSYARRIYTNTDVDFFSFTATVGRIYHLDATDVGGALDCTLVTLTSRMALVIAQDANGNGGSESITWTATSSGTFYATLYSS